MKTYFGIISRIIWVFAERRRQKNIFQSENNDYSCEKRKSNEVHYCDEEYKNSSDNKRLHSKDHFFQQKYFS